MNLPRPIGPSRAPLAICRKHDKRRRDCRVRCTPARWLDPASGWYICRELRGRGDPHLAQHDHPLGQAHRARRGREPLHRGRLHLLGHGDAGGRSRHRRAFPLFQPDLRAASRAAFVLCGGRSSSLSTPGTVANSITSVFPTILPTCLISCVLDL